MTLHIGAAESKKGKGDKMEILTGDLVKIENKMWGEVIRKGNGKLLLIKIKKMIKWIHLKAIKDVQFCLKENEIKSNTKKWIYEASSWISVKLISVIQKIDHFVKKLCL